MKILNISLDSSILDKNSVSAKRMLDFGMIADKYSIITPSRNRHQIALSENVKVYGSGGASRFCQLIGLYRAANRILGQESFDCITTQDPFEAGMIGLFLRRKFKVKLNVQEHGDFFSQPYWRQESFLHLLRYIVGRMVIRRADSIRVVSNRIKDFLISEFGIAAEKIIVVPVYTPIPTDLPPKQENPGFVFLSIGRYVRQKNLPMLLGAFQKVYQADPLCRLRLAGQGPLKGKLEQLASDLGISQAVEFLPWTNDIYQLYRGADAYVLSSNYEGWGRVLIEAAAAGLPIVSTDVGCIGEVFIDGKSALVSPAGDESALANNMSRLAAYRELGFRLSAEAGLAIKNLPDKAMTLELYQKSLSFFPKFF